MDALNALTELGLLPLMWYRLRTRRRLVRIERPNFMRISLRLNDDSEKPECSLDLFSNAAKNSRLTAGIQR